MAFKTRYSIKNILLTTLWIVLGGATVFLLAAAIKSKSTHRCKNIEINIHGVSTNFFVDKKDLLHAISTSEGGHPVGKEIGAFDLGKLERELEKNVWIKSAELFFDNNEVLQVSVQEREPVARVFTVTGSTFYIDEELAMLPLSEKFSARLPVFTNFPSDKKVLAKADSSLLLDIKTISLALQKDPFCMAMIDQVDITPQRVFEMIPKIGNQLIVFGDGTEVMAKLEKMKIFYKEIMVKAGWNKYSVINLQYKDQVVAKIKGAEDIAADSMRTLQLMQIIAERAQQQAIDSLQTIQQDNERNTVDSTMIQKSIQRDEQTEAPVDNATPAAPPQKDDVPVIKKQQASPVPKPKSPAQKPAAVNNNPKQPKAVLNNKNEYAPVP